MPNMLLDALQIRSGSCVAVVGAGGKTTLCWRLAQALAAHDERVLFTTTTKIWQPQNGVFDGVLVGDAPSILEKVVSSTERTLCLAASMEGSANTTPVGSAGMPSVQTKLAGFSPDVICQLKLAINQPWTMLVEADGARGLRLKAPANNEPQIPACADEVCVLANLDAIGRPLDDRMVHRVDRVAHLARTMPGSIITPALIATVLTHPDGGLKGIPPTARKVAVLTQHNDNAIHPDAAALATELRHAGFDSAVVIAPRATQPVLLSMG